MWVYNNDLNKWNRSNDLLKKYDFDLLKRELSETRFYSRFLSGATYIPINNLDNIYDIFDYWKGKNWYINTVDGSSYSEPIIPSNYTNKITQDNYSEFYNKYLREYGFTLKNSFTPKNLIDDSLKNYYEVDVCTNGDIDLTLIDKQMVIDGVKLINGHKVLVKDKITLESLQNTIDPSTVFISNYTMLNNLGSTIEYTYFNSENGIYTFNDGKLTKDEIFDDYEKSIRYSIYVKLGDINKDKQFHLSRLLNGYYPQTNEPMEFVEKHNWLLRNRVDYNNLFEINYYDVLKHATQSYDINGITYSIPERTLTIGEFGVILNTQFDISNIIKNKYKVNLRSITQTTEYYFICGDDGVLLKVRKHDFLITPISISENNFKSIDFVDDLNGVVVGDLNTIYITSDGGLTWNSINIQQFDSFIYNKALFYNTNKIYVVGNTGVFIELNKLNNQWKIYKRRISKFIDSDEEYVLVDNINDMKHLSLTSTNLTKFNSTNTSLENVLIFTTNNGNIILHDIDNVSDFPFLYIDLENIEYDIQKVIQKTNTDTILYTTDTDIKELDLSTFSNIGIDNIFSNVITNGTTPITFHTEYVNNIFDYDGIDLLICGNTSLFKKSNWTSSFNVIDNTFSDKLKSKFLILNYDVASKLNFFEDNGTYRTPNSLTFSNSITSTNYYIGFEELEKYYGTNLNGYTQSQTNWLTYWKDSQKTFEYYSDYPMDQSTQVLISSTFSYNITESEYNINTITDNLDDISYLCPTLLDLKKGRFEKDTINIVEPNNLFDMYIKNYIMVLKVDVNYPAIIGDVFNLSCNVLDNNFILNKIVTFGTRKYLYFYTEFNENITNSLVKGLNNNTLTIKIKNLNKYKTLTEFVDRFNIHPISIGYKLIDNTNFLSIQTNFNNYTSYYNMGAKLILNGASNEMKYTEGMLDFGFTPTYNILDYLIGINSKFTYDKVYTTMPVYKGLPFGQLTPNTVYTDTNGYNRNRIKFGNSFKLEWESLLINTFVDININGTTTTNTEKLLIINKYYNKVDDSYVIEFHKTMDYTLYDPNILNGGTLDIISRRSLKQISSDLQELNNIQRGEFKTKEIYTNNKYINYESELNHKYPTDSYAKILLSDVDTVKNTTGIIYTDDQNRLSLNITNLGSDYEFNVNNIQPGSNNSLIIQINDTSNLNINDSVIIEYIGTSSVEKNYLGYHIVDNVYNNGFSIKGLTYSSNPTSDCIVRFSKRDPFFNYEPVDIIDYTTNKRIDISVELNQSNLLIENNKYKLKNVDLKKYRFKLVDGLTLDEITIKYQWILEAEIRNAIIGKDTNGIVWYSGIWDTGRWFGGTWISGTWKSGDWYGGIWNSKNIEISATSIKIDDKNINNDQSIWLGGRWYDGTWNGGKWNNGRWYGGTFNQGKWYRGIWNDGTFNDGEFTGGIWVLGTFNKGIFNTNNEPCYWLDGKWNGGDFENGMWYNGTFEQKNTLSRFGTKSFNTRTSTWHGGKFLSGSFHSRLNLNEDGTMSKSIDNKLSTWKTGTWYNGQWYGGVSYNMNLKSGTWHNGILEEIQVIGAEDIDNEQNIVLNGIFRFNIGDEITILNMLSQTYDPLSHKIIDVQIDESNKETRIRINPSISYLVTDNMQYRLVSKMENLNWKSGIWSNGIYESGNFEGGIWYDGIFKGKWC